MKPPTRAMYKDHPLRGAAVVAHAGGRIVLIKNRKRGGSVEVPCGKLEPGEDPAAAAVRELFEEAGARPAEDAVATYAGSKDMGHYTVDFYAIPLAAETVLAAGDDAQEAWWGAPEEILTGRYPEDYALVIKALNPPPTQFDPTPILEELRAGVPPGWEVEADLGERGTSGFIDLIDPERSGPCIVIEWPRVGEWYVSRMTAGDPWSRGAGGLCTEVSQVAPRALSLIPRARGNPTP